MGFTVPLGEVFQVRTPGQRDEPAVALRRGPIALIVGYVPQHAAMRHDRALGASGGAGCVGLKGLRIVLDYRRLDRRCGLCELALERQKALACVIEQQSLPQRQAARNRERIAMSRGIDERKNACGIADDVGQRSGSEPDVERERDCAGAHGSEEKFDELGAVADQHGDALAWADPEADKHSCNALHARVEPPVGRATLGSAEQIDDRDLVRHAFERLVEEIPEIALVKISFHAIMLSVVVPSVNSSITELDTRGTTRRQDGLLK